MKTKTLRSIGLLFATVAVLALCLSPPADAANQFATPQSVQSTGQVIWKATPTQNVTYAGGDTLKIYPFSIADGLTYVPYDTTGAKTTAKIRYRELTMWITGATTGLDSVHVGIYVGADNGQIPYAGARFKTFFALPSETVHLNTSATAYTKVYIPEGFSVIYPYVLNKDAATSGKFTIWFSVAKK